ncbi:hypothetical protein M422DRAFT_24467 [Sphaerobolus stellatus SS14]|nr:hypothetical protein M422DRAFT_24467 [Sphaerobolus stellatus SS14]
MLITYIRSSLRALPFAFNGCRSLSTIKGWKPGHAIFFPLTPLDNKYTSFIETVKQKVDPRQLEPAKSYPSDVMFVTDSPGFFLYHIPVRLEQTMLPKIVETLEKLRGTLASTGPLKLDFGDIIFPSINLEAVSRLTLQPTASSDHERLSKLFRLITAGLYESQVIRQLPTSAPDLRARVLGRWNTVFDATALPVSLKDFGAIDPQTELINSPGRVKLDLGTFEVSEVVLRKFEFKMFADPTEPLVRIKL